MAWRRQRLAVCTGYVNFGAIFPAAAYAFGGTGGDSERDREEWASSFECPDVSAGDSVSFYKVLARKNAPRWRGPPIVLGGGEMGVKVKFLRETLRIARYCVRKPWDPKDLGDVECNPKDFCNPG